MSRETAVFIIGLLLVLVPNLGFPESWKYYFYLTAAITLLVIGYSLRRSAFLRKIEKSNGERDADSFVEHKGKDF